MNKLLFSLTFMFLFGFGFVSAQLLSDELEAYFNFDELSGLLIDHVSGTHNGTPLGSVTLGNPGIINNSYFFQGGNGHVNLANPTSVCMYDNICSISLWIKSPSSTSSAIWSQGSPTGALKNSIILYVHQIGPPGRLSLQIRDSTNTEYIPSTISISDDIWHHIVIVGSGSEYKIYIDGTLNNQGAITITPQPSSIVEDFGMRPGGDNWYGLMDEVGLWNRSLSAAEVSLLYNNGMGLTITQLGIAPPTPPILSQIGHQQVTENQTLSIQLSATDLNGDPLTFLTDANSVLPSQFSFNNTTGLFEWTPTFNDHGIYNVTFYVTDGTFVDYETVEILVSDVSFSTISYSGIPIPGNTIIFDISDPQNPNTEYIFSGSLGNSPGINLGDGRIIPLNNDWLFNAILWVPQLFGFLNSYGSLDSNGNAQVQWTIPTNSGAQPGLDIHFSFVTVESPGLPSSPTQVVSVAPSSTITIQ